MIERWPVSPTRAGHRTPKIVLMDDTDLASAADDLRASGP
jgi:hypothetical protein